MVSENSFLDMIISILRINIIFYSMNLFTESLWNFEQEGHDGPESLT